MLTVLQEMFYKLYSKFVPEYLADYWKNGYVIVRDLYTEEDITRISNMAHELKNEGLAMARQLSWGAKELVYKDGTQFALANKNDNPIIERIVWAGASKPELLELGRTPPLLQKIAQILNVGRGDHLINQLHYKIPGDGVTFPYHMDEQNRLAFDPKWAGHKMWGGGYVVSITAIDEVTINNGPLFVYPGSHLLNLQFDRFCGEDGLPEILKNQDKVPLLLHRGDTAFMHPKLVHASWENDNLDGKTRITFLNGVSSPGANHVKYPGEGSSEQITLDNKGAAVDFLTQANMLIYEFRT